MTGDYVVVLDACVLVRACLRDTLLRLAEKGLFLPRWSESIIAEVVRTLEHKLHLTPDKTAYLISELRNHFGDAWVEGYEALVEAMKNESGDRHVLAAAVRCGADQLVTCNLKHFARETLEPWGIEVQSPDDFLMDLYYLNPGLVIHTLHVQARDNGFSLEQVLKEGLAQPAPKFCLLVSTEIWSR